MWTSYLPQGPATNNEGNTMYISKLWETDLNGDGIKDFVANYTLEIAQSRYGIDFGWAVVSGKRGVKKALGGIHYYAHLYPSEKVEKEIIYTEYRDSKGGN